MAACWISDCRCGGINRGGSGEAEAVARRSGEGEEAMILLSSIQGWSEEGFCVVAMSVAGAGVSFLRLWEEWFAVFASVLLVERIAHEQSRQGRCRDGNQRVAEMYEGAMERIIKDCVA